MTSSQEIIKVKSSNRIASGISRYFDLKDVTGKYSSTNLYGSDGVLYRESYTAKQNFSFSTQTDIEGAIENTPAIGFSLCDFDPNAYLDHSKEYIKVITKNAIENGMPESIALNVNIPAISSEKIKGIKFCRQANAIWEETFDKRHDPYGREYYWMVGNFVNHDKGKDNDEWAIKNNYVSIVPCKFDLSSKRGLNYLNENWSI